MPVEITQCHDPCTHARNQYGDGATLWTVRMLHESAILHGMDGLECVGADHFPFKDDKGRLRGSRCKSFAQGPGNATRAMLGAGDEGLLGTERFEAMREGIQLCEAMVSIQKAIEEKRISGDLLERANRVLDDRAKAYLACRVFTEVNARGRMVMRQSGMDVARYDSLTRPLDRAVYALAGEVARASAGK